MDDFIADDDFVPDYQPENFLQKSIRNIGLNAQNTSEYGPSLATMGPGGLGATLGGAKNIENVSPDVMQLLGNVVGGDIGLTTAASPVRGAALGGTIGRGIGDFGKQGIQALFRGKQPSGEQFAKETGLGALTETVAAPFGYATNKLLSGPAGAEFRNRIGSILGGLKDRIANSGIGTHVGDITGYLDAAVNNIRQNFQVDPGIASHLETMSKDLMKTASKKGGILDPQDLMNAERNLSLKLKQIGVFGNKVPKDYKEAGELLEAKQYMKEGTKDIAEQIGIGKQYSKANKTYSNISEQFPSGKQPKHGILKNILEAQGIHGLMRGDVLGAIGNTLASESVGSRGLANFIYNILKAGKGLPTGAASILSNVTNEKRMQ